ncbi:MAG: response regulator [Bdellovibrionales bacterium]
MISPGRPASRLEAIQVMVLEGSTRAADMLREVFVKLGFTNVFVVNDGYEGIRMMKQSPVHLIFTDWELKVRKKRKLPSIQAPEGSASAEALPVNGTDFVKRLRQSPHSPNPFVPVVMVVNDNSEDNLARIRDASVNEVISKPLDVEEMCKRIISLIDDTRYFITAENYKGPCRRRQASAPPDGAERRIRQVRLIRRREAKGRK